MSHAIACAFLHTQLKPQTCDICHLSYILKMFFRRVAYQMSQFKRFSNLDITKKLVKEKYFPQLHFSFLPSEITGFFF